jgi:hypothetical protein
MDVFELLLQGFVALQHYGVKFADFSVDFLGVYTFNVLLEVSDLLHD